MKSQTVIVTATVSVESVHVPAVLKDASVKKLIVKIQHVPIMVSVLKVSVSVRKDGPARTVEQKTKLPFRVFHLAQTMENSTCTLKSVVVRRNLVETTVQWNCVT